MGTRVAGVLAVTGGVAWLAKVALIWRNGGTNTTDGIVGVLFDVGAVAILLALTIRVWVVPRSLRFKLVAVLAVLLAFVAVVNMPIALGWLLFGQIWLAEEVGVLLTAVSAIVPGLRWAIRGRERGRVATS